MELSKDNCHRNRNGNKIINMSIDDKHIEEWLNRIHNDDDFCVTLEQFAKSAYAYICYGLFFVQ
jgi:hypothetical protein